MMECTTYYYCDDEINKGQVLAVKDKVKQIAVRIHRAKNKIPIGICLNSVIAIDKAPINYPHVSGFKIPILTKGIIVMKLSGSLRLPIYQPMYVNLKTSNLTWRNLGPLVGRTTSYQDSDGYVPILVNFIGGNV